MSEEGNSTWMGSVMHGAFKKEQRHLRAFQHIHHRDVAGSC